MPHSYPEGVYKVVKLLEDHFIDRHPKSILDIGPGDGFYGTLFRKLFPKCKINAMEANIDVANKYSAAYDKYSTVIIGNVLRNLHLIPDYELIFMGDVIEHLPRSAGCRILKDAFSYIVITPRGFRDQDPEKLRTMSEYDHHISGWTENDFDRAEVFQSQYEKIIGWKI